MEISQLYATPPGLPPKSETRSFLSLSLHTRSVNNVILVTGSDISTIVRSLNPNRNPPQCITSTFPQVMTSIGNPPVNSSESKLNFLTSYTLSKLNRHGPLAPQFTISILSLNTYRRITGKDGNTLCYESCYPNHVIFPQPTI